MNANPVHSDYNRLQALLAAPDTGSPGQGVWLVALEESFPAGVIAAAARLADDLGAPLLAAAWEGHVPALLSCGARRIYACPKPLKSVATETLARLFAEQEPGVVLFPAGALANETATRLAQRLGAGLALNCAHLELDVETLRVVASVPVYAGAYALQRILPSGPQLFTLLDLAGGDWIACNEPGGEVLALDVGAEAPALVQRVGAASVRLPDIPLHKARRILAVGRAGNDAASAAAGRELAGALGMHFAGDRSAYDAGFIGQDEIIGVIGCMVSPDLYFAVGIWGDVLHNAGIAGAKRVIAVHPNPRAPLLKLAETAVIAAPRALLPCLLAEAREHA